MSCLAPQFKCPPDSRPSNGKIRDFSYFRVQCVMMSSAIVMDSEKLQISSSVSSLRPLPYIGSIGPPSKIDFDEATLANENLLADEESMIAAAAAEAVALARTAAEVAKNAVQMIGSIPSSSSSSSSSSLSKHHKHDELSFPSEFELLKLEMAKDEEKGLDQDQSLKMHGCDLLEEEHSETIAVRSGKQTERKARRARASEKMGSTVVSVKSSGSTGRKKRGAVQEIDYSDPLHYLRSTTSTSRLLTASEELELSEGIQGLLKLERIQDELTKRYGNQPTFAQWAAVAGVDQKTLRKRLNYGTFCKDKMIKSNIRLVISIAKNYQGAGMNLQDLVQEGCRGLVRGAEKFDASKGFKFSTYAHWWIKQAVRKSLSDQSRTIRLPFHMVEATYRVKEARKQLYSENGRYPENEEVAEATGLSMKKLTAVLMTPKAPRSLDQKIGINQNMKPSEVIADPEAESAEDMLMKQFMKQDLEKVLDTLNPREKQVVRWRFGLEDGRMKTLQEIGELMGVSRERIRQIESCAFRKLKNKRRTKNLRQYLVS